MEQFLESHYGPPEHDSEVWMGGDAEGFWDEQRKYRLMGLSMRYHNRRIFGLAPLGLLLYLFFDGASAQLQQKYCSSQNTGAGHYIGSNQWQTLGLCKDSCVEYAFGVVQGFECWCSDYAPNPANARSDCVTCPQYNLEKCGNAKTGAYGYIDTGTAPKGTASDSPASSTASSSTFTEPSTITHTTPWVSVITIDGPPQTVTFSPSGWIGPTVESSSNNSGGGGGDFFDNAGRVAGVFTVLALLLIAAILALFWYLRRRRQKGAPLGADSPTPESFAGGILVGSAGQEKRRSRSMSTIGLTAPYISDRPPPPLPIVTTNSGSSGGSGGIAAITPDRITDQRLDPGQVWMRLENDNASRMSVRSLRDDQDYSRRVLRLANPDED